MTETTKQSPLKDVTESIRDITESVTIPKETVVAATVKPATELGAGLADVFYVVFSPFKKWRLSIEANIEKYKQEIHKELSKIPEEKRIEPPLNIVGPALEASKYYIEDDELRLMFAGLIASSSNADYQNHTLPAFVEILKQLSSFDAKNLKILFNLYQQRDDDLLVSGSIRVTLNAETNVGKDVVVNFIPFKDLNHRNMHLYSASVDNLVRLGLIRFNPNYILQNDTHQKAILNHPIYKWAVREHEYKMDRDPSYEATHIKLINGVWTFTNFGYMFAKCCITEAH